MGPRWRRVGLAIDAAVAVAAAVHLIGVDYMQPAVDTQAKANENAKRVAAPGSRSHSPPSFWALASASDHPLVSAALLAEGAKAVDLRTFALAAMNRPTEGGLFHAFTAVGHCAGDMAELRTDLDDAIRRAVQHRGTVDTQQLAASEKLARRCASFAPGEAVELALSIRNMNGKLDPLFAAAFDGPRRPPREELLQDMEAGDPFLLYFKNSLDSAMLRHSRTHIAQGMWWFDGKVYGPDTKGQSVLRNGLVLGACGTHSACPMDKDMLWVCAEGVFCTSDRREFMRWALEQEGLSAAECAEALSIADRVASALRRRDVNVFLKPD